MSEKIKILITIAHIKSVCVQPWYKNQLTLNLGACRCGRIVCVLRMFKRFRRSSDALINSSSSSNDDDSTNLNRSQAFLRRLPAFTQKYARARRVDTNKTVISDSSSDENNSSNQQENRRCLNASRLRNNTKSLQLTPTNKFQPLSVTISSQKSSPSTTPRCRILDTSTNLAKCSPSTPPTAWSNLRRTLTTLKRARRGDLQQNSLEETFIDSSPGCTSIEANLSTVINREELPSNTRSSASTRKPFRCVKGGFLQEFKRLMQKQRMDRRSVAHNHRLGICSGQRVQVLAVHESFGVHMARVQSEDEPESIFNVILPRTMIDKMGVGSLLELHFDIKLEPALQLRNKELVFIQPNRIVLL